MTKKDRAKILIIHSLQNVIFYAKTSYYEGFTVMDDETYDQLENTLERLCPDHPLIKDCVGIPHEDMLLGIVELQKMTNN